MDACEDELATFKMAGDWRLYLQVLTSKSARVGYHSEPLNTHRRHAASVTHTLNADQHVAEIAACHAFAGTAFQLNPELKQSQAIYLREVTTQLGAPPDQIFPIITSPAPVVSEPTVTPLKRAS